MEKQGGGVAIYIKKNISYVEKFSVISSYVECKVQHTGKVVLIFYGLQTEDKHNIFIFWKHCLSILGHVRLHFW